MQRFLKSRLNLAGGLLGASILLALPASADVERVSSTAAGAAGDALSRDAQVSGNGRYTVFESDATDLIAGDTNGERDIFITDHVTGMTSRVSESSGGAETNDRSENPQITPDGRFVVYESLASNLVAGDTNNALDIFRWDRTTGDTIRVNVASDGSQASGPSDNPDVSADGNLIAFESLATNFGAPTTERHIWVRDVAAGTTTLISEAVSGGPDDNSLDPQLSRNGRFVVFESDATNLVAGDTNGERDVFVHDRETGVTTRESIASDGTQGNNQSVMTPANMITADGRFLVFCTEATNLVAGDANGVPDALLRDRVAGTTTFISNTEAGAQGNDLSCAPAITDNGYFIGFDTDGTNFVTPDDNGANADVLVRRTSGGPWTRITENNSGTQANNRSFQPSLTANGQRATYHSFATNLANGDTSANTQVFSADLPFGYNGANDLTANGTADVLVRHTQNGWWRAFAVESSGVATVQTVALFNNVAFEHQANADFDNDGDADALLRHTNGSWRLFELEDGAVVNVTIPSIFTNTLWQFAAAADFDGDSDADVLMRRTDTGQWRIFEMEWGRVAGTAGVAIFNNTLWQFQGSGDFDGDGDADILLRQGNNNLWRVFNMQNRAAVSSAGPGPLFNGAAWSFVSAGDIDANGTDDIILRNSNSGAWRGFTMQARTVAAVNVLSLFTNQTWQHQQTGDTDGDGDMDLLLRNTSSGAWRVFEIQGASVDGHVGINVWPNGNLEIQN